MQYNRSKSTCIADIADFWNISYKQMAWQMTRWHGWWYWHDSMTDDMGDDMIDDINGDKNDDMIYECRMVFQPPSSSSSSTVF